MKQKTSNLNPGNLKKKLHNGKVKFQFNQFEYKKGVESFAILSQIRLYDIKRAFCRDGKISKKDFISLQDKLLKLIVAPLQDQRVRTKAICDRSISKKELNIKMRKDSKIFVAGGTGLVGSAIVKNLLEKGYANYDKIKGTPKNNKEDL